MSLADDSRSLAITASKEPSRDLLSIVDYPQFSFHDQPGPTFAGEISFDSDINRRDSGEMLPREESPRLESRRHEDEYYYRRDIREVRDSKRSDKDFAIEKCDHRDVRPRDSISGDEYSDEDYIIRKKIIRSERSRNHSPHHKRHLAEGALSGAGAATLLANHARQVPVAVESLDILEHPTPSPLNTYEPYLGASGTSLSVEDVQKKCDAMVNKIFSTMPSSTSSFQPNTQYRQGTFRKSRFRTSLKRVANAASDQELDAIAKDNTTPGSIFSPDTDLSEMDGILAKPVPLTPLDNSIFAGNIEDKAKNIDSATMNSNSALNWNAPDSLDVKKGLSANSARTDNTGSEGQDEPKALISTPRSPDQLTQLWCRAFFKLEKGEPDVSSRLGDIWQRASNVMLNAAFDYEIAGYAQAFADLILQFIEDSLKVRAMDETGDSFLSSVTRLRDIMKVIRETLNFKVGAIIWVCLCEAIKVCFLINLFDDTWKLTIR
jgi:hypothetical protein